MDLPRSNKPPGSERSDLAQPRDLELAVFAPSGISHFPLPGDGGLSIGRSESCDIPVDDSSVSRRHISLHLGSPLTIEDLGSANGTRIAGERIGAGRAVEIAIGDPIQIGATFLVVRRCPPSSTAIPSVFLTNDRAMKQLLELAERVATGPNSVLLLGEVGVGKHLLAEIIHQNSPRAAQPFVRVDCASSSEPTFEDAHPGTLFLDEVGLLPLPIQSTLLRALEDRCVMRAGESNPRPFDVRLIAATQHDLPTEVQRGRFDQELYFRLNGVALRVPPLRERPSDIAPLAQHFAARAARTVDREPPSFDPAALAALGAHPFAGNVRELDLAVERAVLLYPGPILRREHLKLERRAPRKKSSDEYPAVSSSLDLPLLSADFDAPLGGRTPAPGTLRSEIDWGERRRMLDALDANNGDYAEAAAELGMPKSTFIARLTAYRIVRPGQKG